MCGDCGLVLGQVFHHQRGVQLEPAQSRIDVLASSAEWSTSAEIDCSVHTSSRTEDEAVWSAISNALARLFLDTEQMIEQAAQMWKSLSSYRNVDGARGRRELAFVLWKTLMDRGVIREKSDLEAACGAEPNSTKDMEKKRNQSVTFKRRSGHVDTLGAWLGLPFRDRRIINKYMRSFDFNNKHLGSKSPEVVAGASILFIYNQLMKRMKRGNVRLRAPEYMKNVSPANIAELVAVDTKELKRIYKTLPRDYVLGGDEDGEGGGV